jgi:DNA-binding transcriptional ArsR family regulator
VPAFLAEDFDEEFGGSVGDEMLFGKGGRTVYQDEQFYDTGDLVEVAERGVLIAEKLGVSQPTASEHMKILLRAGLVRAKRIKQWTFYKRDEASIKKVKRMIVERV